MRNLTLALVASTALCVLPHGARAQGAVGVNGCGTSTVPSGIGTPLTVDTNTGNLCTAAASASGTPQSVNITEVNGVPANLAQETGGNLATVATAQGAQGTGITPPTGGTGIIGYLSGIYRALIGTGTSSQNVQGSSANGAADDGSNPLKVGCVYLASNPTLTTGNRQSCVSTINGAVEIGGSGAFSTAMAGTTAAIGFTGGSSASARQIAVQSLLLNATTFDNPVSILGQAATGTGTGVAAVEEAGESFVNITTATTTVVKSGSGILHKVCENTIAASASISMFNNTAGSGASLGVITNPLTLLQMGPLCAVYDAYFSTGLTIVTTGTQNITITYR